MPPTSDSARAKKQSVDTQYREHELLLREREISIKADELEQRRAEHQTARWWNPLVVAIFAAAIAALGNAYVSRVNAVEQLALEDRKAENARILQVLSAPSAEKAAQNLQFLLDAGLVSNTSIDRKIREYLAQHPASSGPLLRTYDTGTTYSDQDPKRYQYNYGTTGARPLTP